MVYYILGICKESGSQTFSVCAHTREVALGETLIGVLTFYCALSPTVTLHALFTTCISHVETVGQCGLSCSNRKLAQQWNGDYYLL